MPAIAFKPKFQF